MTEIQPFVFLGCLDLNELLPHEAHDVRELLEQLEKVPVESVFCHTSAALLHRPQHVVALLLVHLGHLASLVGAASDGKRTTGGPGMPRPPAIGSGINRRPRSPG